MREKKRYIKFSLEGDVKVNEDDLRHIIWRAMIALVGELGASKAQLWLSNWDNENNVGMIKCSIAAVDQVIVTLKLIKEINGKKANFIVKGVSGTIKSLNSI